ncbi:MAG: phosphohydrolase, partial [Actinomycetales bacterium]|nr:phosphohydrolase [Actinomycetales bacterium]
MTGSKEVPHLRVRDLRRSRLELAAAGTGDDDGGRALDRAARRSDGVRLVDDALTQLWREATSQLRTTTGIALGAVGSLGRGDLGPASDLDLLVVHDGRTHAASDVAGVAERLWYPIWDAGLDLDHAVRTLTQCRTIASKDLPAAVGLLDLRLVAGDPAVIHRAQSAVLADWRDSTRRRLPELASAARRRAERHGELAYLIEPDLKEARGGLRDATVLFALAATWIADRPHGAVDESYAFLLDVRDELQAVTGRHTNRLLLVDADAVAGRLGLADA